MKQPRDAKNRRPRSPAPTPDDKMTRKEKEELEDQVEQFEGPDRREIRGTDREPEKDPGISHS
jgi:hypothetical protein